MTRATDIGPRIRLLTLGICAFASLSCSEQDAQRWQQFWAASQPASQPESQPESFDSDDASNMDEPTRLRVQRDRLLAANRRMERELEQAREQIRSFGRRIEALQARERTYADELESQRSQLRQSLETLHRNQDEWQTTLADRQKQIDMLTNRVERLSRELSRLKAASRPDPTH